MKRILVSLLLVTLLAGPLAALPVQAQDPTEPAGPQAETVPGDTVTFTMLQTTEISLKGPSASGGIDLYLPADWQIVQNGELHLNLHVFSGQVDNNLPNNPTPVMGFLTVVLNDIYIQTITLDTEGDFSLIIPIPAANWITNPPNAIQSLRFYLEDAQTCEMLGAALLNGIVSGINVVIQPTSYMVLPHATGDVLHDLRLFPYPIYQGTFLPEKAVLVIPSQPTEEELQAAFSVAATLGKLSRGKLPVTFFTQDLLPSDIRDTSQVIFIGKAGSFPELNDASLPVPFSVGNFNDTEIGAEDGVLQIFSSPYKPSLTWMLVSGATDSGVVKAAQALSTGAVRPGGNPDVAVVSSVQSVQPMVGDYNKTLSELGYQSLTFEGYGTRVATYWIDLPMDYVVGSGAYFEMTFVNSGLLNYEESGLSVSFNDDFIGGIRYSDRTTSVTTYRFPIPPEIFRPGENLLSIQSSQHAKTPCVTYSDLWFSISSESYVYLPVQPATETELNWDISAYPVPLFAYFDRTAIVVAREDPSGWASAAAIAYDMGVSPRGTIINPVVFYGDSVPTNIRDEYEFLVVGRASTLPFIGDLREVMPAPFPAGQDTAVDPNEEVSFKIPSDTPVGYLQIFASPWNNRRGVLVVAGTNAAGVQAAASALTAPLVRRTIDGNFAVVSGTQVIASQIDVSPQLMAVDATPTPDPNANTDPQIKQPININFVMLGVAVVGVLFILGIIYFVVSRFRRKPVPEGIRDDSVRARSERLAVESASHSTPPTESRLQSALRRKPQPEAEASPTPVKDEASHAVPAEVRPAEDAPAQAPAETPATGDSTESHLKDLLKMKARTVLEAPAETGSKAGFEEGELAPPPAEIAEADNLFEPMPDVQKEHKKGKKGK